MYSKAMTIAILQAVLLIFLTASLAAQAKASSEDFRFTVAPYAWLTGIVGTVGVRGVQANVDASFADLSKYLNFGVMLHADMTYLDTFGILGEINYSQLGDQASGKRVSIDGQMGLLLSDIDVFYRLGTVPLGKDGGSKASFDLLAGARIWSLGMSLKTESFRDSRSISKQKSWVDPIVGARALIRLTDKWNFDLRGGVGGFGISSAFTWDAMAVLGYSFWEHGAVVLGYRAVGVNHCEGSGKDFFKFDATLHGPVVGVAFTF